MPDLFISYTSHDRRWAERLYKDLKSNRPTLEIFLDRESIKAGANWREELNQRVRDTRNLAVLWSDKAKESNEVQPEISAFQENVIQRPQLDGVSRTLFYIPLQGSNGPLEAIQGYPAMRALQVYDADVSDRGASKLDSDVTIRTEWTRIIQKIGDTLAQPGVPVLLGILAMNKPILNLLDPVEDVRSPIGEPTLRELLNGLGLNLTTAKSRYGDTAFEWCPYGTHVTVIDVMEELRLEANKNLLPQYQFHWLERDIYLDTCRAGTADPIIEELVRGPSVVVIDPISLYNLTVHPLFERLDEYLQKEDAVFITLSPVDTPGLEPILRALRAKGANRLKPYFLPHVPAAGAFAGCGLNLRHAIELERVVRYGLGRYHKLQNERRAEAIQMTQK